MIRLYSGVGRNLYEKIKKIGSLRSLTPTVFSVEEQEETFKYLSFVVTPFYW